jgi:hypothetical protein
MPARPSLRRSLILAQRMTPVQLAAKDCLRERQSLSKMKTSADLRCTRVIDDLTLALPLL